MTDYTGRNQFLPARNTQYSRHMLLKKQREQILKLRQINLVARNVTLTNGSSNPFYASSDKNCKCQRSSPFSEPDRSRMSLPKTYRSPYSDSRTDFYLYGTQPQQHKIKPATAGGSGCKGHRSNKTSQTTAKATQVQQNQEMYELRQCYRRIFNGDVESFKLLLRNQDQFGKPKIALNTATSRQQPPSSKHAKKCMAANSVFPKKKTPYVPHTFLRTGRKKTVSPSNIEQLVTNKPIQYKQQQQHMTSSPPPDQKPILMDASNIVINLPDESPTSSATGKDRSNTIESNDGESSMSREEFININQEMLENDLIQVPNSDSGLLHSRSSSSVSNIVEEMIKDKKIQISSVDDEKAEHKKESDLQTKDNGIKIHVEEAGSLIVDNDTRDSEIKPSAEEEEVNTDLEEGELITDTETVVEGVLPAPSIGLEVVDENGEKNDIIWHDPEVEMKNDISEALLDSSKSLAAKRKSELRQLLDEYTTIAQELEKMEVQ